MKITIGHLYPDLLNLYGDRGNIQCLMKRCQWRGIEAETIPFELDDKIDFSKLDIVLLGGGSDREQMIVCEKLQKIQPDFKAYVEDNGVVIAICGGYQLLGHYYVGANGEKIPGLGVLDHYTLSQDHNRFIGDITIKNEETGQEYHGFENHNGKTYLGKGERPLGKVVSGHGNNGEDGSEGAIYKNVYCSYFHGPILTRNGEIAKKILLAALHHKYPDADLSQAEALEIKPTF